MTDTPNLVSEAEEKGLSYKWKVLWSVVFGLFMVILDQTVVNVAFPTLRGEFGTTLSATQWVLSIYVMAMGISTPLAGFLGDKFGMKRIYVLGLALFVLGSLFCGISPSLELLIVARALQGIGGGLALPLGSAQLFRAFPPKEQGLAFGVFGITLTVAPALGPILGGWLVTHNLWRWIFFINIPIGLFGVFVASRWLLETKMEDAAPLSISSFITSTIGFGAVLYAASIAADEGWTSWEVMTWFAIGSVGLAIFAILELWVVKHPLLDLRLFKNKVFLNATLVGYVATVALFGAEFLMPVYLQALRGQSAFDTGLMLLPLALTAAVVTGISGRVYDKIGPRMLIIVGYSVLLFNTWELTTLTGETPFSEILWLLAIRGIAIGMTVQATFTAALSVVPRDKASRGSSLINASRNTIQAIAVALLATILTGALSPKVKNMQNAFQEATPTTEQTSAHKSGLCDPAPPPSIDNPFSSPFDGGMGKRMSELKSQACKENLDGLDKAYSFTFYAAIIALILGFFLPGWPGKWTGRDGSHAQGTAH